eukprot:c13922_g1_i1 orf=616-1668(-)
MAQLTILARLVVCLGFIVARATAQLVPALIIFGDSTVDVGNNNYLKTVIKSNFAPYGRDFDTKKPTGRFCDGRLATDYTAEVLGFNSFPLPYLDPQATGQNIVNGINFASAGSGFFDSTAQHFDVIPLSRQLELFKDYTVKLSNVVGPANASSILSQALYIVSSGSSDFLQNYYVNLRLRHLYTVAQFSNIILDLSTKFIKDLYSLGARRIGVVSLAPFGCLPSQISLSGQGKSGCVERLNQVAAAYNHALNGTLTQLPSTLPELKVAYFDIYNALLNVVNDPGSNGFTEVKRACCGTGTVETAILCNQYSPGTCSNASQYVFWDSFHPSQAANQILANSLILQGISLIT